MVKTMGLAARKELVKSIRQKYCAADWNTKRKILIISDTNTRLVRISDTSLLMQKVAN